MPLPQEWPRQNPGVEMLLFDKEKLNDIYCFLEAIAKGEVVITPNGIGAGKILATPKKWVLHFDFTPKNAANPYLPGDTNFGTASGSPSFPDGPFGGVADAQSGDGSAAYTDEWHRDKVLLDSSGNRTDGLALFTGVLPVAGLTRTYVDPTPLDTWLAEKSGGGTIQFVSNVQKHFQRRLDCDRWGPLFMGSEVLVRTDYKISIS